jgi:hypothetical protein
MAGAVHLFCVIAKSCPRWLCLTKVFWIEPTAPDATGAILTKVF